MSSRKEFEEWCWNEFGQFEDDGWMQCFAIEEGDYYRLGARMSWAAWQASRQAFEIALPVLEQQEKQAEQQVDSDGWIEWKGGECPVDRNTGVEVKHRNEKWQSRKAPAFEVDWQHRGWCSDTDIIAYRVIENDGREG